jgi:hypothetical protein
MTGSRPGRVWGLVASQAAGRGGRVSAADVCAAAVAAVEVTGAWLSAARGAEAGHLMRVTDEVGEQLAELHLTLGEGPCLDAAASGGPVLASDLAGGESGRRWPVFALAARQAGAAAAAGRLTDAAGHLEDVLFRARVPSSRSGTDCSEGLGAVRSNADSRSTTPIMTEMTRRPHRCGRRTANSWFSQARGAM